jgi:serine/threonine-protein kinase
MVREVVIKVLRRELSVDPDYVARFQSETQILAQLNHPHIIKLFDTGALESRPYYVMEKVEGGDLEAYVRRNGPLSIERACELGRQAALALQHIHSLGVIHGDIRPAHLLVSCTPSSGADSVLKIIDWSAGPFDRRYTPEQ